MEFKRKRDNKLKHPQAYLDVEYPQFNDMEQVKQALNIDTEAYKMIRKTINECVADHPEVVNRGVKTDKDKEAVKPCVELLCKEYDYLFDEEHSAILRGSMAMALIKRKFSNIRDVDRPKPILTNTTSFTPNSVTSIVASCSWCHHGTRIPATSSHSTASPCSCHRSRWHNRQDQRLYGTGYSRLSGRGASEFRLDTPAVARQIQKHTAARWIIPSWRSNLLLQP